MVTIVNKRNYSLNQKQKKNEILKEEFLRLSRKGIIKERFDRLTPVIVTPRRTGGYRLCIDLGEVNESSIKEVCQQPIIEECLNSLPKATVFLQLDFENG